MLVFYAPDTGFAWSPAVLDMPSIKPVFDKWGESGLHYMCLFGHPLSVHSRTTDLSERDGAVLSEMRERKLGQRAKTGAMNYPNKLYTQDIYDRALPDFLSLPSVPDVTQVAYLKRKLAEYQKQEDSIVWSRASEELAKQAKAAKDLRALITQTAKELNEAEGQLQALISQSGTISLDVIWNLIN